jgi:hypothetical protein
MRTNRPLIVSPFAGRTIRIAGGVFVLLGGGAGAGAVAAPCVTVYVWPAIVSVAVRLDVPVFDATE